MYTGFLELINNMLTSGMVPALYPDDEKEAIIGQVNGLKLYNIVVVFFFGIVCICLTSANVYKRVLKFIRKYQELDIIILKFSLVE